MSKINFGAVNGRRIVTFKVSNDTSREAFRRWKIARKAWKTRKTNRLGPELPL